MFFFFNDTATTEIYTLSLHDALPISARTATSARAVDSENSARNGSSSTLTLTPVPRWRHASTRACASRSEEHTSELQSRQYLVCRLLLEKKKYMLAHSVAHASRRPLS